MPTIADLIAAAQREKVDAQRRVSDAETKINRVVKRAEAEGRSHLSTEEEETVDRLVADKRAAGDLIKELDGRIEGLRQAEREEDDYGRLARQITPTNVHLRGRSVPEGPVWVRTHDQRPGTVARDGRFRDHEVVAEYTERQTEREKSVIGQHGSFGHLVRAMTTTSGSAVVPTVWAADIIDRARSLAAVIQAGAEIVPMDAKTVQIGRLTGDPTAAFRAEGSTITASDPTFDNVTLDSKTMSALVVGSLEWFMDADNVDQVVTEALAQAVALHLDLQALFGGVTAGAETGATGFNTTYPTPPNPRGILATLLAVAASNVLGGAANGTVQTAASFWREVQQAVFQPQTFNEQPSALLWPAKLAQKYTDAYDTTNQPLMMPGNIAELPRFTTNQIPAAMTQGTGTNMADLFVGDFTQLLIGQRLDMTVQTLTERYAENGQIGIVAHWRGDVQLARPRAFAVYRYLQGAV